MKARAILLLIGLLVANTNRIMAQTTVPLAGACTDCAAVITAFNNCSVASAGTLKAGTIVDTGVTQTIQLTVGKVGKYSLSTTNNGVTFAASGTFTALGLQTVVLTASGYTVSGGTTTFTLSSKSQSCTFDRTVGGPTTVITGPCPSNLKFWKTDSNNNRYAISTDSVLYAMPYVLYGKNNVTTTNGTYRPESMIISPTRVQNVPKMVAVSDRYAVGVDGYIYFLVEGGGQLDSRDASNYPYLTYPYSYVGNMNIYNPTMMIFKFPLPPTGTKWVDISIGNSGTNYGLTDNGDVYLLRGSFYANGAQHLVKFPVPLGTDAATFKYTKIQTPMASFRLVLMGNDGNYYSMATAPSSIYSGYIYGWGSAELTAPSSDFATMVSLGGYNYILAPTSSSQIRKMLYPAGTVLADGSDMFTVDGKIFALGTVAEAIGSMWGSVPITTQSMVYFKYPLKDGDYSYNRPDIRIRDNRYWDCTTPREVALPAGATKFVSAQLITGMASISDGVTVGTGLGSKALIALTDNGSYGLHPQKINNYWPESQLTNMALAGVTTAAGSNIYYPKYVPSLPAYSAYHIPRNSYGLGLDGTYYTFVQSVGDIGGVTYSPMARYQEQVQYIGGTTGFYDVSDRPGVNIYSLLLNGNCDYNNPHPEP